MSIPSSASSAAVNAGGIEANDIRGLKPLEAFTYPFYVYAGAALLALFLVAALAWLFRRRRKTKGTVSTVSLPSEPLDVVILRRLEGLKERSRGTDLRPIHFQLSEAFRDYLEGRYGFPASDWTTEEILASLNDPSIRKILSETDDVKFAGSRTDPGSTLSLIEAAIDFVRRTRS